MSDPQGALAIFAEVSVALAGFSGIVITFGSRRKEGLNDSDRRRLSNLFFLSGIALLVSLLGVSFLNSDIGKPDILWRGGSAILFLLAAPWLIWDVLRVRKLENALRAEMNPYILYTFNSLATAMLLFQLANVVLIGAAWPFFLALVLMIVGAFQQFVLLVRINFYGKHGETRSDA